MVDNSGHPNPNYELSGLTDAEMVELAEIGKRIIVGLACNVNGTGVPCHTDRQHAIKRMIEYLLIHDYAVIQG